MTGGRIYEPAHAARVSAAQRDTLTRSAVYCRSGTDGSTSLGHSRGRRPSLPRQRWTGTGAAGDWESALRSAAVADSAPPERSKVKKARASLPSTPSSHSASNARRTSVRGGASDDGGADSSWPSLDEALAGQHQARGRRNSLHGTPTVSSAPPSPSPAGAVPKSRRPRSRHSPKPDASSKDYDADPELFFSGIRNTPAPAPAPVPLPPQNAMQEFLIPPPRSQDVGKLIVVLDLDETLVSSRGNSVFVRPGTEKLLQVLKGNCELIVWTAGTRDYALDVIKLIDPICAVQHCIYRHPMWWDGQTGCTKDLRMLGRPLEKIVFIDNTPDVFRANPKNSILVSDFFGSGVTDHVLSTIADIFTHVFRRFQNPCAANVFASRRIKVRRVQLDNYNVRVELNTLADDTNVDCRVRVNGPSASPPFTFFRPASSAW